MSNGRKMLGSRNIILIKLFDIMLFKNYLLLMVLVLTTFVVNAQDNRKPNIIIILADDMGYVDVGPFNSHSLIPTPAMNKLAKEGMIFTDAHSASSVCTPSRYSLLTGRYAWRTALKQQVYYNYEPPLIESSRMTIASMLKTNGYNTAAIGKWHLGLKWKTKPGQFFDFNKPLPWSGGTLPKEEEAKIDFNAPIEGGPVELGFDYFYGASACATCNTPYCYIENDKIVEEPTEYFKGKYLEQRGGFRSPGFNEATVDSIFTMKAIEFIERSSKEKDPFFLYLAASAPHEPAEEDVVPQFMRGASKAGPRGDLVVYFDWMVGKIMSTLKKAGVANNTLIIVTSDNGPKPGNFNRITYGHKSNGDLRGFKGSTWDGGHRVPLIVKWPGKIKPGSVNNNIVGLQDIMATAAEIVNINIPGNAAEDSKSFLYAFSKNPDISKARKDIIHHSTNGVFAIRSGNWKLIVDCDNSGDGGRSVQGNKGTGPNPSMTSQLYNLSDDPFELFNLLNNNKEKANELRETLVSYQNDGRSIQH